MTKQGLDLYELRIREENPDKAQLNVRQININRSAALDKLLSEARAGRIWVRKTEMWDTFKAHMTDMKRATATLRDGSFQSMWQKSSKGNDHMHFALLYLYIAAQMRGMVSFGDPAMPGVHRLKLKTSL